MNSAVPKFFPTRNPRRASGARSAIWVKSSTPCTASSKSWNPRAMGNNREETPELLGIVVEVQRRTALVAGDDGKDYSCQYSPTIDLSDFSNFAVGDRVHFIA